MKLKAIKHLVLANDEGRLDRLLALLTGLSRNQTRNLLLYGGVQVNSSVTADAAHVLKAGDQVELEYDMARQYRDPPKNPPVVPPTQKSSSTRNFSVVYNDASLVVVHKEAGLLTVPTEKLESQNLLDLLSRAVNPNRKQKLAIVHRLDRETSGLLVFGQDQTMADRLIAQFSARKPERVYWAIVKGKLKDDRGTIRTHLSSDKALNQRSNARGEGELAITHFEVLERYASATLLKIQLETGRRNQIRAHFAELGHPVLGDQRYEREKAFHKAWPYKRLALHAGVLGFEHPASGEKLRFEQPLPREFLQFSQSEKRTVLAKE